MDIIRWSLGSTAVRITEEYIYGHQQRIRLAHFLELMEMLNPYSKPKVKLARVATWKMEIGLLHGRHVGLTTRQPPSRVLMRRRAPYNNPTIKTKQPLSFTSDVNFRVLVGKDWPHDKIGIHGKLVVNSTFRLTSGKRHYIKDEENENLPPAFATNAQESAIKKLSGNKWRKALQQREPPVEPSGGQTCVQ
ncbi:hypothetical protein HanPSC8_Chr14g0609311 [Helianthus annuus]|nr:hypothetical protein HanPSC8_Chr14g0609311 [Helianthus annuus]